MDIFSDDTQRKHACKVESFAALWFANCNLNQPAAFSAVILTVK